VSDESDEDAIPQVVRVVDFGERHDKRAALDGSRPSADQYTRGKLNGEVARRARHPRSILAVTSGASARMLYEDATRKLLAWNFSFTQRKTTRGAARRRTAPQRDVNASEGRQQVWTVCLSGSCLF